MISKNISYQSSKLLEQLIKNKRSFFSISDAIEVFPGNKKKTTYELINNMIKRGLVLRIKDGLYHIIPYEADSSTYFPNWHLVGESLVKNREYYIGFYSALDIHGLIIQPSLKEQIVTKEQIKPKNYTIKNRDFEFITLNNQRFFGFKKVWINDYEKVNCSDIEKSILDCLYKPAYAGGITEIVKALFRCRKNIDEQQLLEYIYRYKVKAVNKRIGYLLSNLQLFPKFTDKLKSTITPSYILLDPSLPPEGKSHSEWRINDNVGIENILESIKT